VRFQIVTHVVFLPLAPFLFSHLFFFVFKSRGCAAFGFPELLHWWRLDGVCRRTRESFPSLLEGVPRCCSPDVLIVFLRFFRFPDGGPFLAYFNFGPMVLTPISIPVYFIDPDSPSLTVRQGPFTPPGVEKVRPIPQGVFLVCTPFGLSVI